MAYKKVGLNILNIKTLLVPCSIFSPALALHYQNQIISYAHKGNETINTNQTNF